MYEKPQYLTPDGYRRMKSNPYTSGKQPAKLSPYQQLQQKKKELRARKPLAKKASPKISEQTARLIAEAIKNMLNS